VPAFDELEWFALVLGDVDDVSTVVQDLLVYQISDLGRQHCEEWRLKLVCSGLLRSWGQGQGESPLSLSRERSIFRGLSTPEAFVQTLEGR